MTGEATEQVRKIWESIAVHTKDDLPRIAQQFSEMRITSGSSGQPAGVFYDVASTSKFIERACISLDWAGVTKHDVVLNVFSYGNYIPGSMYERACYIRGIPIIPIGSPTTYPKDKVISLINHMRPTVWLGVPSYLINIIQTMGTHALPRLVCVAGERLLESYVEFFSRYGIQVSNQYGLTECPAIGCSKDDPHTIHVIDAGIIVEPFVTESGTELLVTDLHNKASPILRYATRDVITPVTSGIIDGIPTVESFRIVHRSDDLVKLQGAFYSKSKLIESLSHITADFTLYITTHDNRDVLEIHIPQSADDTELCRILDTISCKYRIVRKEPFEHCTTQTYKRIYCVDTRQ